MAGLVAGAHSFQARIAALKPGPSTELSDQARAELVKEFKAIAADIETELKADGSALGAATRQLDTFSYADRAKGVVAAILHGLTTPAHAVGEQVDALAAEVGEDKDALAYAHFVLDWHLADGNDDAGGVQFGFGRSVGQW